MTISEFIEIARDFSAKQPEAQLVIEWWDNVASVQLRYNSKGQPFTVSIEAGTLS